MDKKEGIPVSVPWQLIKLLFVTNIITLILWFGTIAMYTYEVTRNEETNIIDQNTDSGGNNSNIINKGELNNGKTEDSNKKENSHFNTQKTLW